MTQTLFNIANKSGEQTVTATLLETGETLVADGQHPSYKAIIDLLLESGGSVDDLDYFRGLFDVESAINAKFAQLTERVSFRNGKVYFDGDPVYDELADTIVKYYTQTSDFLPLANFMEKIATNPNPDSRKRLFAWLRRGSFGITSDGDFLAYKRVYSFYDEPDVFRSVHAGTATVNGQIQENTQIEQSVGDVVEMPRSNVDDNTHNACSTGLHAGTYGYASTFSGDTLLAVKINPRDVVSVPNDSGDQKLRTCRYVVYGTQDAEFEDILVLTEAEKLEAAKPVVDEYDNVVDDDDLDSDTEDADLVEALRESVQRGITTLTGVATPPAVTPPAVPAGNIKEQLEKLPRDQVRKIARRVSAPLGTKADMIDWIVTYCDAGAIKFNIDAL